MLHRRLYFLIFLGWVGVLPLRTAEGQTAAPPLPATIVWSAPPGCPTADAFEALIERHLGHPPGGGVRAYVQVVREGTGWRLTIRTMVEDSEGQRVLPGHNCAELADAAALILAMVHEAAAAESAVRVKAVVDGEAPSPARRLEEPLAIDRPGEQTEVALSFGFLVGAGKGALPSAAPGYEATAAFHVDRWHIEGSATVFPSKSRTLPDDPDSGGDVSLRFASVRVCREFVRDPVGAGVCVGGELGELIFQGFGALEREPQKAVWEAFVGTATMSRRIYNGLYLKGEIAISVPILRNRFHDAANPGTIYYQHENFAARLLSGLEVQFR